MNSIANTYTGAFRRPTFRNSYVRVIAAIQSLPGRTRKEIHALVFGERPNRGNRSAMWNALVEAKCVRYDEKYRYFVEPRGSEIVKEAVLAAARGR